MINQFSVNSRLLIGLKIVMMDKTIFRLIKKTQINRAIFQKVLHVTTLVIVRDVSTGATSAIAVAPKFSDTLTLF